MMVVLVVLVVVVVVGGGGDGVGSSHNYPKHRVSYPKRR